MDAKTTLGLAELMIAECDHILESNGRANISIESDEDRRLFVAFTEARKEFWIKKRDEAQLEYAAEGVE